MKSWFQKKDLKDRNVADGLKTAYSMPTRSESFEIWSVIGYGFSLGTLYAFLLFIACVSVGDVNEIYAKWFMHIILPGFGFGLTMAAITERWEMGFMIERLLTIIAGCILLVFVC